MSCVAILVNFHSSWLIVEAVGSLVSDPACDEIHVVDNSVSADEAEYLRCHLPKSVRLTVSQENIGFAGACNLVFANTASDFVLLLNPDARLLPDALQRMLALAATSNNIGAVGPRVFWDDAHLFQLPPTTFPSASGLILDRLSARFPVLLRLRSQWFRYRSIRQWVALRPFRVDALSGGHVLVRRAAAVAAGGLFDPAFFMYWEDSDLMQRLRSAGFMLYLEPGAGCVHHYEHGPNKDALIGNGWPAYATKHFSGRFWQVVDWFFERFGSATDVPRDWPVVELADRDIQIVLPEALHTAWLIEFSPSCSFVPSMGRLGRGSIAEIPGICAKNFRGRDFYIRISDARRLNGPVLYRIARPVS